MKRLPFTLSTAAPKIAILASIAILAGCAVSRTTTDAPHTFRFNHNVTNRAGVGVLRAFDDRSTTVIQFVDIERQKPEIFDKTGNKIPYNTVGQYAIINGTPTWFMIKVSGETAIVTNLSADPVPTRAAGDTLTPAAQATAAGASAIAVAWAAAQSRVDTAPRTEQAPANQQQTIAVPLVSESKKINNQITAFSGKIGGQDAQVMRITFNYKSTDFKPSAAETTFLLPTAQEAKAINLRGRTDSNVADQVDRDIAKTRALAARKFLIENGVAANKIRVYASGAGKFVADNRTAEGRAKNRRVEIELVGVTTATANAARRDAERVAKTEHDEQQIAQVAGAR